MMDDRGKSHSSIVPGKPPNKAQAAEGVEGSELAKGKTLEQNTLRTQGREGNTIGRNPQTGKEIKIAARKAPKFKAGSALKKTVK